MRTARGSPIIGRMKRSATRAILTGGCVAATLDILLAMYTFSWRVPRAVAGGLFGRAVFRDESLAIWSLGLCLHFAILCVAAAIYYAASRRMVFLREYALACGLFYGIAIWLVMNLVVLPLSALHDMGPYPYRGLVAGLLGHMVL